MRMAGSDEAPFRNRREAGRVLATALKKHASADNVVVLALPRGGVPVAFEVADALGAPQCRRCARSTRHA